MALPHDIDKDDRHFVTALARGLDILACFRTGNLVLSNQELATRCRLPKSTVSRLTYTLVKLGYLTHDVATGKYRVGLAALALGVGMMAKLDIRQLARPFMQELANSSGCTVTLGTRERLSMLYLESCRSNSTLMLSLDVGSRLPIATTSMGRAYLAVAEKDELDEIMQKVRNLDEQSSAEIVDGIVKAAKDYQTLGCTCSFGDWLPDVNAIAVAFRLSNNFPIMVINCAGPSYTMPKDFFLNKVRPKLLGLVDKLKASIGQAY